MSDTNTVFVATGRRKTATARVRLLPGTGKIVVNDREPDSYFAGEGFLKQAIQPLETVDFRDKVDVVARVQGGGIGGQATAVSHGIARALLKLDPELRVALKRAGHLKRDPRQKERKKSGQPGARKRFQFSKR